MIDNKHLLYGIGDTENIVSIEHVKDTTYSMFIRHDATTVTQKYFTHVPFVYVCSSALDNVFIPKDITVTKLNGSSYYDTKLESTNKSRLKEFVQDLDSDCVYTISNSDQPYISSGETLFNNMVFDSVKRFYFDIETLTTKGYNFTNPDRKDDAITIIVILITYMKTEQFILLRLDEYGSEKEMLKEFIQVIRETDPDVIIGHNAYNFDLPFIQKRCILHHIDFAIGRNGRSPYTYQTAMSFADKKANYTNWNVFGRTVLDTMYMAMKVDVVKRDLPSYKLKELAVYLGVASDDRNYIDGGDISAAWLNEHDTFDREYLCKYAKEDVYETRAVDKAFGQSFFYSSQFLPCSYQDAFRLGSGGRITGIFVREYYRNSHSIPKPEPSRDYGGGFSGYTTSGHISKMAIGIDIESMYPTLGEELELQPKSDELKIYQPILKLLKQVRLTTKYTKAKYKKENNAEMFEIFDSQDGAFKIYLNTMSYGSLADEFNPFNDYDCAESITKNGRRILRFMMFSIESHGGRICKWDTDGILVVPPDEFVNREEE